MTDERLVYKRKVSVPTSWPTFAVAHLAFGLHRVTGWLLLGWVVLHLAIPAVQSSPEAVYLPTATPVIVALLAILVFHSFNGIRLLVAELTGLGTRSAKPVFAGTMVLAVILLIGAVVLL